MSLSYGGAPASSASPAGEGEVAERKMRILFVGAFAKKVAGGAVGGVMSASQGLIESPLAQHVEWLPIDTTGASVPPPPIAVRGLRAALRLARFSWALATRRADAAYILTSDGSSFVEKGAMALLARAVGVPVILNPRSGLIPDDIARSRFFAWFVPFVLARCSVVLCQAESWRSFYRGVAGERVRVEAIPNWVAVPEAPARAHETPSERLPLKVLYLGWIERFKGIFDLLEALALLKGEGVSLALFACGGGSDLAAAKAHAERLGLGDSVRFEGWVSGTAKAELMRDMDLYAHPSHREGMPNALLEAMAMGIPPVAARSGAVPDVIPDDSCGRVVEAGDVAGLARALRELALDPALRLRIARSARARIVSEFTIDAAWPRMLALFESLRTPR